MSSLVDYDIQYLSQYALIGGMDEAGRGPLAGPVVVAGCIMPLQDIVEGVNDSKKLSENKRNLLYDQIVDKAIRYHIAVIDKDTIDSVNILNATKLGMQQCIQAIMPVDIMLIDAVNIDSQVPIVAIIKGDATSYNIACASILAKVYRDRLMLQYDKLYPQYGFAQHKGYGTAKHIEILKSIGKCPIHRDSFIGNFVK